MLSYCWCQNFTFVRIFDAIQLLQYGDNTSHQFQVEVVVVVVVVVVLVVVVAAVVVDVVVVTFITKNYCHFYPM